MSKLYFGYNPGHFDLKKSEVEKIKSGLYEQDQAVVENYERKFLENVGNGYGFSVASGRMAFYVLLRALNIGSSDEVIVVGFTCSVMINAILRTGAKPVYSDVDPVTFGSEIRAIEQRISGKTRMIVAQHSFGIPCNIVEISKLAKEKNVFLLEDSALAYGSSINGTVVGNFGNAAIFSTDHTKPLNTLIGGFFYTKDKALFDKVTSFMPGLPGLSDGHKKNLLNQLMFEKQWHLPSRYWFTRYFNLLYRIRKKALGPKIIFMDGDNGPPDRIKPGYPYPSKLPSFLALAGIFELEKFDREKLRRKHILNRYLEIFRNSKYKEAISQVYFDTSRDIIPLRFVFSSVDSPSLIKRLSSLIDFSQIWFRQPVIATRFDLEEFGYIRGTCPNAEKIGEYIINFPCVIPERYENAYFDLLEKEINQLSNIVK